MAQDKHDLGLKTSIQNVDAFVRSTPMGNQPWPQFQNGIRERSISSSFSVIRDYFVESEITIDFLPSFFFPNLEVNVLIYYQLISNPYIPMS